MSELVGEYLAAGEQSDLELRQEALLERGIYLRFEEPSHGAFVMIVAAYGESNRQMKRRIEDQQVALYGSGGYDSGCLPG